MILLHTLSVNSNDIWTMDIMISKEIKKVLGGIGAMYPKVVIVQMPSVREPIKNVLAEFVR